MRRTVLVGAVVWGGFAACSPAVPEGQDFSEARLLDERCDAGACELEGSARRIQGLTPDSVAYELGPGAGKLSIPVSDELSASAQTYRAMALMKGRGSVGQRSLESEYAWQSIALDLDKKIATVEVSEGSHAIVADVRIIRYFSPPGCS